MALRNVSSWALTSLGLVPNCVMSILCNECGCSYHMQGCDTRDLEIGLKMLAI